MHRLLQRPPALLGHRAVGHHQLVLAWPLPRAPPCHRKLELGLGDAGEEEDVVPPEEAVQRRLVQLDRRHELLLDHVDVREVDPYVRDLSDSGLAKLRKDLLGLREPPRLREDCCHAVGCVDVVVFPLQHLAVEVESAGEVLRVLVLRFCLVGGARLEFRADKVDVSEHDVCHSVIRVFGEHLFELLLGLGEVARPEMHFGEHRPRVRVPGLHCERFDVPPRGLLRVAPRLRDSPEAHEGVEVVGPLFQNRPVQHVRLRERVGLFVEAREVVEDRNRVGLQRQVGAVGPHKLPVPSRRLQPEPAQRLVIKAERLLLIPELVVECPDVAQQLRRHLLPAPLQRFPRLVVVLQCLGRVVLLVQRRQFVPHVLVDVVLRLALENLLEVLQRLDRVAGSRADHPQHLPHLVAVRVHLEDFVEASDCLHPFPRVHVRLAQAVLREHELRPEMRGILIVLVCLVHLALDVVSPRNMKTALRADALHLRVLERLVSERVGLIHLPPHDKVVCQMVENHR
mmetsp:Transcript_6734/g.16248  ORF Transcript_6734/g.16248 Transcript_6734/m.16248 type:complete len:512 (-) Transcript_6734:1044-2579(-)